MYFFQRNIISGGGEVKCFHQIRVSIYLGFGCRWSQTYGEGGHYSVWIQMLEAAGDPVCTHTVDKTPNNAYLRK